MGLSRAGKVVLALALSLALLAGLFIGYVAGATRTQMFATWNSCGDGSACALVAGEYRVQTVPDTFDYYVSFNSTVPVNVFFLTLEQYGRFVACGMGCVSGTYQSFGPATSLSNAEFKLAEGCGDYVAVFQPLGNGLMYPNVKVVYHPSSLLTGICATP